MGLLQLSATAAQSPAASSPSSCSNLPPVDPIVPSDSASRLPTLKPSLRTGSPTPLAKRVGRGTPPQLRVPRWRRRPAQPHRVPQRAPPPQLPPKCRHVSVPRPPSNRPLLPGRSRRQAGLGMQRVPRLLGSGIPLAIHLSTTCHVSLAKSTGTRSPRCWSPLPGKMLAGGADGNRRLPPRVTSSTSLTTVSYASCAPALVIFLITSNV